MKEETFNKLVWLREHLRRYCIDHPDETLQGILSAFEEVLESESDRKFLSPEEAIAMLPSSPQIHTIRESVAGVLIGADWSRNDLITQIKTFGAELTGSYASRKGYGLAIPDESDSPLFVETKQNDARSPQPASPE